MPSEVDQALAVIYRELESVTALKQDIEQLQNQVRSTEQARRMMENQLALARAGQDGVAQKNAEIATLKEQLVDLRKSYDALQDENSRLKQRAGSDEEVQVLKSNLRRLLGD
jgi:predicted  nucleic acid-binding Zn-ribbon protein